MRILNIVSCVLLTTLILGCDSVAPSAQIDTGGTESTDSFAAKNTVKLVPFKGTLTGPVPSNVDVPPFPSVACPPSDPPHTLILKVQGSLRGTLSHFGLSTVSNTHCGDIKLFPNIIPLTDGKGVIRAANGDEVFYTYEGYIDPSPVCGVSHVFELTGTITGGTGRFAGASGEISWTGTQVQPFCPPDSNPPPGFVEVFYEGQISSVGSSGN